VAQAESLADIQALVRERAKLDVWAAASNEPAPVRYEPALMTWQAQEVQARPLAEPGSGGSAPASIVQA